MQEESLTYYQMKDHQRRNILEDETEKVLTSPGEKEGEKKTQPRKGSIAYTDLSADALAHEY